MYKMFIWLNNNYADYGGGLRLRNTKGELSGGVYIEQNPIYFKFSPLKITPDFIIGYSC